MSQSTLPTRQGLYDPRNEHDACGVGFIVHIKGQKSHEIVRQGLELLKNLTHRGAVGADIYAGDGAGILIQMPDAFLRAECDKLSISLPKAGDYAAGMVFLPRDAANRATCEKLVNRNHCTGKSRTVRLARCPRRQSHLGRDQSNWLNRLYGRFLLVAAKIAQTRTLSSASCL